MLFVVATFVGVLVLILAIYWVALERPETREQGALRKRLGAASAARTAKRIDIVKPGERLSAVR